MWGTRVRWTGKVFDRDVRPNTTSIVYRTQNRMVGVSEKMKTSLIELRVGTRQKNPKAVSLKAGALTVDFVAGGLRTIRYEGHEVLRAIAYVVRDQNWGTYNPEISECLVEKNKDAFTITYRARCASADAGQTLSYQARITGNSQGHLVFEVAAEPLTPFLTARCGFAVLHPINGVAGQETVVEHVDGAQEQATFPDLISPAQPFKDIRAIQHRVTAGIMARCVLNGDVFEMEDQRNWSDASYKTYVRPLSRPWPYVMEQGVTNRQSVELIIKRSPGSPHGPARNEKGAVRVTVAGPDGSFPGIGVSVYPELIPEALAHPNLVPSLRPQFLLFHFDPTKGHGRNELSGFSDIAQHMPASERTEFILELVLPAQQSVRDELLGLAEMAAACGLRLSGILVSPAADRQSTLPGSPWPACPPLSEIYEATREAFPGLTIGGGSLSYFTELNRKRPPVELLDFVSHCTCPIIHAADDLSVMETLEALPHIARSTRAFIGQDKAYRIGPSTIGMRHNPYGARVMDNPGNQRITMSDHDPRQTSLFGAAWMIGYVAATVEARLQSLTVGSLTGRLGLASAPVGGKLLLHPAFHAARGLAELGGHQRYECQSSRPGCVAAVAGLDREARRVAWLANLTGRKQEAVLEWGGPASSVLLLDEQSLHEGGAEPWREWTGASSIQLLPYSLACLRYVAPLGGE
jgi:D-apionolactonase